MTSKKYQNRPGSKRAASLLGLALLACAIPLRAEPLQLGGILNSHAVIQRDAPVPLTGRAAPGAQVHIRLADREAETQADAEGNWSLQLPAPASGGPYELTLRSGQEEQTYTDLWSGDVWVFAGQSNMAFRLEKGPPGTKDVIAASGTSPLRFATVRQQPAGKPQGVQAGLTWSVTGPDTSGALSAVAYFAAKEIQKKTEVPIGILVAARAGTMIESWIPAELDSPSLRQIRERWSWLLDNQEALAIQQQERLNIWNREHKARFDQWRKMPVRGPFQPPTPQLPPGPGNVNQPAVLYNGLVRALTAHPVKGVVWYQGESNTDRAYQYRYLLQDLIRGWRGAWGQEHLPFVIIQLPNYDSDVNPFGPQDGGPWPELRESQAFAARDPHAALVVTLGLGLDQDVHPPDKSEVGRRAGRAALALAYGVDAPDVVSPSYKDHTSTGSSLILSFDAVGDGLRTLDEGPVLGFELAGADGLFHPAEARILAPRQVEVSSAAVPNPVHARHAWHGVPRFNLAGSKGLPVSSFRTDSLPLTTQSRTQPFGWLQLDD